ncbi:MAG: DUF1080 domain-containing protein [Rikenellaceae bacterium]|nr:DUF1080 domain-containing protein [Rikenellaceae bacterium]
MKKTLLIIAAALLAACGGGKTTATENWVPLFNGSDLEGWTPKFAGFAAGENYANTFRVEDGILKISYEDYEDGFNGHFGHLFTDGVYSSYILRLEYRFVGEQAEGAPAWAYRNNGAMLHSQHPETMGLWQNFPVSVEAQILGGNGTDERPTANVCTPGTTVAVGGERVEAHCSPSRAETYHGDRWVTMDVVVFADSLVHHIIEGDTVLTYTALQIGGNPVDGAPVFAPGPLREGHIAIQAEGHPTEFRRIDILEL